MKKLLQLGLIILTLSTMTLAETVALSGWQDPQLGPRPATSNGPNEVPAGTEIRATLDSRISSDTAKVGDTFTATVAQNVAAANGAIAIPAGSKIQGDVTEVQKGKTLGTIRGDKAKLNMRFRQVTLPSGQVVPITATLLSVSNTKNSGSSANNEGEVSGGTSGGKVAKDVGIGAAAGTVAGLIFGSALKGLAIGAIAGGGYVLATGGKNVDLPQQTGLTLRLDQPVSATP